MDAHLRPGCNRIGLRPGLADGTASPILALGALIAVYAASLLGYLSQATRAAAQAAADAPPTRSRPLQAGQITAKAA